MIVPYRFAPLALAALAFVLISPAAVVAETLPAAIAPTASWALAPSDADCTLSRNYGVGAAAKTLAFRPEWGGLIGEMLLVTPASSDQTFRRDPTKIWVGTTSEPIVADSKSGIVGTQRITEIVIPDPFGPTAKAGDPRFPDPPIASTITLQVGQEEPVTFAMPGAAAGFAALTKCQDALMDKLGVFPYERRHYARDVAAADSIASARGNPGEWITADDYPAAALAAKLQGDSVIFWTIGEDGAVHDCRTLYSSGSEILDQAACSAITRRGRYTPAIDKQGRPIAIHDSRHVVWQLP
ncbi:energy transducer TonB [Sphingomonas sp. RB3P16]|uniref:energy transducer TonB n=1 Tax=Parasphingomonas frigoris TaxID=3096163 RepID=UPI002FC6C4C3